MLLLLPLLLVIGFEATLFFNTPYMWKLGGCPPAGLGACYPVTYDWFNFALDWVFYALLGYWAVVVGIGLNYRLFRTGSSEKLWKREVLKGRFKMALLGGGLMLALPLLALPTSGSATHGVPGVACMTPSPCFTRQEQVMAGWNLTTGLWGYSIFLTLLVSILGVVEDKWHRLLGAVLIGLSGVYLAGVEAFFSTGAYTLFGAEEGIIAGFVLPLGPLLALSGAFLVINPRPTRLLPLPNSLTR